uniref:PAS domain S-box protein n=1 Tax=candidate division WOR-3 bacterium TaxID=2052148 RepID=A0A7V1EHH4_UNCW3
MKILVVDDKEEGRKLLEAVLTHNGFEVVSGENGKQALEILKSDSINIIIADILMPVMDGYTLLSICKSDPKLKNLPFIFYTATYVSEEDEKLAMDLGADLFIRKPVEIDEFIARLNQTVRDFYEKKQGVRTGIFPKIEEIQSSYNRVLVDKLEKRTIELENLLRLYNIFDRYVDDLVFWLDENGCFTAVNHKIEVYGYTKEEVIGKHFYEFLTPKSQIVAREHFEIVKKSQYSQDEYEVEAVEKNGSIVILNLRLCTIRKGNKFIGRFGIGRDITKLRKSERKLKSSELRYQILFHNIPVGVFYYNKDLILADFNDRFVEMLQSTREKLLGLDLNGLKDQRVLPAIKKVFEGLEGAYTGYYEATTGSAVIYAEMKCAPIYDEDNNIIGGVGLVHDITEKHNAEERLVESLKKNQKSLEGTVNALASAVEKRDPYTAGHQRRVATLACAIARVLDLDNDVIECLNIAGILHDIGKIYVPAEILSKPARLTQAEFDIVKEHPRIGAEILESIEFPWPVAQIILQHHERLDGSGYPSGLRADKILLEAKILSVADVVEAMMTHRPYGPAWNIDVVLTEIISNRDILYDSKVVDACARLFREQGFKF